MEENDFNDKEEKNGSVGEDGVTRIIKVVLNGIKDNIIKDNNTTNNNQRRNNSDDYKKKNVTQNNENEYNDIIL